MNIISRKKYFLSNISFVFVLYWAVLVLWQNIVGSQARNTIDMLLKIGLLVFFVISFLNRSHFLCKKTLYIILLSLPLLITAVCEKYFSVGNLISYLYPIIFLLMVYGIGDKFEINRKQLITFCNCVIIITLYAALYALIFYRQKFINIGLVNNAYGNELSSFFISSHEYGMYLASAIISCLICLKLSIKLSYVQKSFYIISIILFSFNLVLTFSRTSILSVILFLLIYIILDKSRLRNYILVLSVFVFLLILCVPEISNFLHNIVFKGNSLGSREILFSSAIDYYQNGEFVEKVFGHGINSSRQYFESSFGHGSVHNSYLQILLYYGLSVLTFLIAFLISQFFDRLKLLRKDRFIGGVSLGLLAMACLIMFTNTSILFTSSIDSFFLTIFTIVVPKYVRNSICNHNFYCSD